MTGQSGRSRYRFDPELAEIAAIAAGPVPTDPETARARVSGYLDVLNADVDVSGLDIDDRSIPGPEDSPDVVVRVYSPKERTGPGPAVLYLHGGGFVVGSIESEHGAAASIARELGVVVVSVEYRLAPEHPFPAALEDCHAVLVWLHEQAGGLDLDTARVAVSGSSAGGGLAAGLALLARDLGGPPICFQYLGVPEIDDRLETASMQQFDDTPMWSRPAALQSWRWYLSESCDLDEVSPYAAPARATDLSRLPATYISTMEYDPLRDEGIIFGLRLLEAGVTVELHSFPGTFHGSGIVATAAVTRREADERILVLRRALGLA
jgi:acetyl esterase